jgi:tetratricopeptide (TPR) repeat protein
VKHLVVEKIPLFALSAVSCVTTLAAQRGAIRPLDQLAFSERLANAAVAYVGYLGKMLYPTNLAVLYPLPKEPPPAWEVVAAFAVLLAISLAVFVVRRRRPYLLVGWLWYLGTLAPVIGLVQVGSQAMADRYTYLTQIGLYMAIAWGAADVVGGWPNRRWVFAAASVVMAGLMACGWRQTHYWRDSETLWAHTVACTTQNPIAHCNLGFALVSHGHVEEVEEAIKHFRRALELKPDYVQAHNNLGLALSGRGRFDEAIRHYRKALEIQPDYVEARINIGVALASSGRVDEAIEHFQKELEIKPDSAEAHNNLGVLLTARGKFDNALQHYQKALELASARNDLALADAIRARINRLRH